MFRGGRAAFIFRVAELVQHPFDIWNNSANLKMKAVSYTEVSEHLRLWRENHLSIKDRLKNLELLRVSCLYNSNIIENWLWTDTQTHVGIMDNDEVIC
jgi:hypothetical protein